MAETSPMSENKARMQRGELYYAFTPELIKARDRASAACNKFNSSFGARTRRAQVELWKEIVGDKEPLPPPAATTDEDEQLLEEEPWVCPPITVDYGTNVKLGKNVFINFNCTMLDTCTVSIGSRTLVASGVNFFSGTHPLDPAVRNGTKGPELGAPIIVGEDVWIGGNVTVLPGVTIGDGAVIGAASVVTKDVAPYTVVAGNPARYLKDVPRNTNAEVTSGAVAALEKDREAGR